MAHHGSSPLARGLRVGVMVTYTVHRIIPARAGFTLSWTFTDPRPPDHPRSRGVYLGRDANVYCGGGSSPLARGLPAPLLVVGLVLRIIPARAGFTPPRHASQPPEADHPRSRGVYKVVWPLTPSLSGSSPLARGLHRRSTHDTLGARIIPARAGFTFPAVAHGPVWADHPRSRGVYAVTRPG